MGNGPNKPGSSRLVSTFYEMEDTLRLYILKRLSVEEEAQDILQELFLRLIGLEEKDPIRNRRSYLFEIAHNLTVDRIRKNNRERVRFDSELMDSLDMASEQQTPEQITHDRQRFSELMAVMNDMPENWRKALIMHRWENRTYSEIGEYLGVTHHAVKKYLSKAIVFCQKRMGQVQ